MEITINYNGRFVSVEVSNEVYKYLDLADHKTENLAHEQRRHWDEREFDEYIIVTEGCLSLLHLGGCYGNHQPAQILLPHLHQGHVH